MTCLAFDIDGTIFDCGDIIVEAFRNGIDSFIEYSENKIKMPSREKIISVLGIPTEQIFQQLFPVLERREQQIMNDLCMYSLVDMIDRGGGYIYEGVFPTIKKFYEEGYTILAASNGRRPYIEAILRAHGLIDFFTKPVIVLDSNIQSKAGIVKHYKENICKKELLIMIGDRHSDMDAAKENAVPFIGCSFGHAGIDEIQGTTWITHDFNKIYDLVKEIENTAGIHKNE
jgi:phosphoglycolate phosphatase